MITNQSITVDLMRRNSPVEKIYCKQNDSKSRNIRLSISENGVPLTDLTAPAKVYYEDYKYRSLCYQDVQITNGVAEFTIVQTALSVSGEVRAELQILNSNDEEEILSSATFIIDCDRQVNLSGRAGGDGKDVLETMVEKAVQGAVDNKVDKEEGKGLSSNDYTNTDKELVQSIPNKANTSDVNDALENKVDKIPGKRLSTNDYTNIDQMMVQTISGKANVITVNEQLAKKQDKLTAGTNITIEGNVISATGGGGTVDQHYNENSTNAQSGKAVAEALAPINHQLDSSQPNTLASRVGLAISKSNNAIDMLGDVPEDTDVQTEINDLDGRVTTLEQGGGGGDTTEIYGILKVMKAIIKKAEYTEPVTSLFAQLEQLLPDGVVQDGNMLTIRGDVTVVQDGNMLTIS